MPPLPLSGLQHVSLCVRDPDASCAFYRDVLGFAEVKRPSCLEESFDGSWLWGYGLGIHLIQGTPVERPAEISSRGDHLSFQADDLGAVADALTELDIPWIRERVVEGGVVVTQIFFKDPDHNMIEICDCACLPVIPLGRAARRACSWRGAASAAASAASAALPPPATSPHGVPTGYGAAAAAAAGGGVKLRAPRSSSSSDEETRVEEFA